MTQKLAANSRAKKEMNANIQKAQTGRTEMKNHSLLPPFPPVKSFRLLAREITNKT